MNKKINMNLLIWFVYYWVQTIKEEMISKAGKTTFPFLSVTKLGDFFNTVTSN